MARLIPMSRLILCADDFGYSPGINEAILSLGRQSALSATSVIVTRNHWQADASALQELEATMDIGLHLTLSQLAPLGHHPHLAPWGTLPNIDRLTWLAYRNNRDFSVILGEIADEIERQFDRFESVMKRPPDFIDGHQHCHVLPHIRELVLTTTARRAPGVWMRNCADHPLRILRRGGDRLRALRSAWLGRGLASEAREHGLKTNDSFAGYYDFSPTAPFEALCHNFLSEAGDVHLVMCHPGNGQAPGDRIALARQHEYQFLASPAAARVIAEKNLQLGPFPRTK
ncbi:ChbG/HpnK family deacetylase [Govanella unica]|uniref:ChbG/HpnK family deacetylase n=1 Tax=Govanella unica TaxID=2975056 RepID=A0A9X3TZ96_9PROT|nr:ChbG/HpnK family deacetylase [Govania unica]MDA5194184.1 ChbG/HpnK family deacetylase [Govania unica]